MSLWDSTKDVLKKGTKTVTTSLLGLMGATTSTGLVFYCAFKGAVLCSGLGTLIPGFGNIAGFVVGAILGAGFAGALLLLVYKGLIVLDKKAGHGESNFEFQNPNHDRKLIRRINNLIQPYHANRFSGLVRYNNQPNQLKLTLSKIKHSLREKTSSILRQFILARKNLDIKIDQIKTNLAQFNNNLENRLEKLLHPSQLHSETIDEGDDSPQSPPTNLDPSKKNLNLWNKLIQPLKSTWLFLRDYKNFFKYAGGAAAIGTVVSCAYYGAMIGGTVGTAIPIIGNIGGFIVGGILGAVTAGVLVFMVGKGVITLDNTVINKNKKNPKNDLIAQLKKMKAEITQTKEQFMQLKIAALEQINILNRTEQKRLQVKPASSNTDINPAHLISHNIETIAQSTSHSASSAINDKNFNSSIHTTAEAHINNLSAITENNVKNAGFLTPLYNLYQSIKKPTVIIAGVPAAIVTILSCSYYGAMIGTTLGTAVPGLGNLAGLIIGAILGAAVAGALIYVAANGLISLDEKICGEDKTSKLIHELEETEKELVSLKNQVNELNQSLEAKKQNYAIYENKKPDHQSSADIHELAMQHDNDNSKKSPAEDIKPLLTTSEKNEDNQNSGFFNFIANTFNNIKNPILKFLGGTAGAITIGTCGYYGAMIGLSAGSIFPGPGNIIGGVAGAVIGAVIGLCFVTITAKLGTAVYEKISHNNANTVEHKVTTIEKEVTNIEENKNTLNDNLEAMKQIWEDTYNYTSDTIMSDRLNSGDLSDKSHAKEYERKIIDRHSHSSTPTTKIDKPSTPAHDVSMAPNISQTLLPPPIGKPIPKNIPPIPPPKNYVPK